MKKPLSSNMGGARMDEKPSSTPAESTYLKKKNVFHLLQNVPALRKNLQLLQNVSVLRNNVVQLKQTLISRVKNLYQAT